MLPETRLFFWVRGDDGQEYGPVGLDELREWVQENRAGLGTVVRRDEPDAPWQHWQHFPELVALLAEVQVTGPGEQPEMVFAPIGMRFLAGMVDLILGLIPCFPIFFIALCFLPPDLLEQLKQIAGRYPDMQTQMPTPFVLLTAAILYGSLALYQTGFLVAHGQTPAKALLGIRVVDASGQKPGPLRSFVRALVLIISIFYLLGFPLTYMFINPQRRTLHDYVAGTYVVQA